MKRSTLAAIMSVAVLATGAMAIESCSAKRADDAGLMVIVTTDGRIEVDSLKVFVWREKRGEEKDTLTEAGRVYNKGQFTFPATIAILSDGKPGATVVIQVVAYSGERVVDIRENIIEQVPVDRVGVVPIVLSANCLSTIKDNKSECVEGETCNPSTGRCGNSKVVGSGLDTYVPGAVVDGGVGVVDSTTPDGITPETIGPDTADASDTAAGDIGCAKGTKLCGSVCQPTDIAHGCEELSCESCPSANGTATCSASGACELTCSSSFKKCSGACVGNDDPTYGCGPTTCDSASCPAPGTGTLTCSGGACVIGSCGEGTKKCGSVCVTTDATNGCADVSRCTPCAAKEACLGSPTVCSCISDATTTTCSGKCGVVKDNCGKDVTCPGCTLPATCGAGGSGTANVCGVCNFTTAYPPAPSCHPGNREWRCWSPVAMDGSRTADFVVRTLCGDDVISDTKTKLMWARSEEVGNFPWKDAKSACAASRRAGFADWRLPTAVELQSIVDYQKTLPPTIDGKFQGPTTTSGPTATTFWSSSSNGSDTLSVNFNNGIIIYSNPGSSRAVRCVR